MNTADDILFVVTRKEYTTGVGLPPSNKDDHYMLRSTPVGKLMNAIKIFFSPKGDLFAVRGGDLFKGPVPSEQGLNWFETAKRVGKVDWGNFKFTLFDPHGILYAVTSKGDLYRGPAPTNENVPWLYHQANKIGCGVWNSLKALFFDPEGVLYAVKSDGHLVKGSPPGFPGDDWLSTCIPVGNENWSNLSRFIGFSPAGDLWCVDDSTGRLLKWGPGSMARSAYAHIEAEPMGQGFTSCLFFAFTADKIIHSIESFEFLTASSKIVSQKSMTLNVQTYINSGDEALSHKLSFSKTIADLSTFSQDHGFTVKAGAEITFSAGIPCIDDSDEIALNTSVAHTWDFTKTNEIQNTFPVNIDVIVRPHSRMRVVASVMEAVLEVPYSATIHTMFGSEATIKGMWKGVTHYNLTIAQGKS
ncbi:Hypothetical predicted protein [Pelobates cultripes]|uniref:Tachylectin 2 domain-containing protein n=1 Tax=Pelobates cultripes TaxID=61616 RepID=A0AAD1SG24_PELCU|nr:Hypothetical predicted protein [Pelobates cultripes]